VGKSIVAKVSVCVKNKVPGYTLIEVVTYSALLGMLSVVFFYYIVRVNTLFNFERVHMNQSSEFLHMRELINHDIAYASQRFSYWVLEPQMIIMHNDYLGIDYGWELDGLNNTLRRRQGVYDWQQKRWLTSTSTLVASAIQSFSSKLLYADRFVSNVDLVERVHVVVRMLSGKLYEQVIMLRNRIW
jgi:hypothetical protein